MKKQETKTVHLKKFEIWFQCKTDALLSQQRTDDERKPLWYTNGILVNQLIELPCSMYSTSLNS